MNDSAASIGLLKDIIVDQDFESVCPPLTEDEFSLLEQNILSDGEVTSPLIVWNNNLIDGHHRRQIILQHPELPFQIKEIAFNNKYEAVAWICKNQAGRRNLTSEQLSYLIGKRYQAEKQSRGSQERFQRKDSDESPKGKIYPLEDTHATAIKIADENGISEKSVRLFGEYSKGVDAAETACPGVKQELLSGSFKPTKPEVIALSKLPAKEVADKLSEYRRAQAEREEKRKQAQDEKRRRAEEAKEAGKQFTSISELSANMAEPKRRNDVSNVIGIIKDMAQEFLSTCETFFDEFPELKGTKKPTLLQALVDLKEFVCFASEDRYRIVEPIVYHLCNYGIATWYDRFQLLIGDDRLRKNLIEGAQHCKYALAVISPETEKSPCAMEEL